MKIIMLSPNAKTMLTPALEAKLTKKHTFELVEGPGDYNIKQLNGEDYVLGLDPDYSGWKVPDSLLANMNIKAICLQSTSYSWLNVDLAQKRNIPVLNLKNYSTQAVAEWGFLMAESLARKVPLLAKSEWKEDFEEQIGVELEGKVAGIIGLGNIGTKVAELCQARGMRVIYYSRRSRDNRFFYSSLSKLMKTSDFIFPCVARNKDTEKMISRSMYKGMKKTAIFATIAYEEIFDHKLLLDMVANGELFGYGFEEAGGGNFHKYKGNVWAGPPHAWLTKECMERNIGLWVNTLIQAAEGNYTGSVN